jgi:hypothetical protein
VTTMVLSYHCGGGGPQSLRFRVILFVSLLLCLLDHGQKVVVWAQDDEDLDSPKYVGAASDESQLNDGNFLVILNNATVSADNLAQTVDSLVAAAQADVATNLDTIFNLTNATGIFGNLTERLNNGEYVAIRSTTSYLNVFFGFVARVDDGVINGTNDDDPTDYADTVAMDFREQVQGLALRRRIRARILRTLLASDVVEFVEEVRRPAGNRLVTCWQFSTLLFRLRAY